MYRVLVVHRMSNPHKRSVPRAARLTPC